MKKIVQVILFISVIACGSKDTPVSFQSDHLLKNSISAFNNAFKVADVQVLDSLLTTNYKHTNGTNPAFGKEEWLAYIKQRRQNIDSGKLRVVRYEMDQIEIQQYKQTAVVVGRVLSTVILEGEERSNEFRVTHLWTVEDGVWKRAAFHDGKIK